MLLCLPDFKVGLIKKYLTPQIFTLKFTRLLTVTNNKATIYM